MMSPALVPAVERSRLLRVGGQLEQRGQRRTYSGASIENSRPPLPTLRTRRRGPQKHELRIVIAPPLDFCVSLGGRKARIGGFLDHRKPLGREPGAVAQRGERSFRKPFSVRRVEKHQPE